jgi:hypothetical protein
MRTSKGLTELVAAGVTLEVFGRPITALPEYCIGFAHLNGRLYEQRIFSRRKRK